MKVPARARGRLLVVSPCRDEVQYVRTTIDSVAGQTVRPDLWLIVDDGSTDGTSEILAECAARLPFVRILRRPDRGARSVGPGVVDAFQAGLDTVDLDDFEFVCKLDLDLDLPRGYFAGLMSRMQTDPRLGSCSGKPFYRRADRRVPEPCDDEIPVGMTKFYRTACFRDVGGFVREVMWDGIDSHRCRMRGWIARSFADAELAFEHLRQMGSSQRSLLAGRRRHGFGQYYMGTGWAYVLASALRRLAQPPLVLGSLAMLCGYGASWLARRPRYGDEEFRRFLRRYQWRCLVSGKRRALQRCEAEQAPVWRAHWATEGDGRSQRAG